MALPGLTFYRDILRKLTTTEADNNIQILSDAIEAGSGLSDEMPDGQIYIGDNTNTASLETLDTSIVPDTTDKRYQTDNQKLYNDATSSIQTQLNSKAIDTDVLHKTGDETATGIKTFSTEIKTPIIQSDTSAGTEFKSNGGTSVATWGAGGGAGWTFKGGVIFDTLTVSTLAFINSSKQLISATGALLGTWVQTLTTKTTPVDADTLIVNDSASSFEAKKLTFGNLITYIISKILPSLTSNYYPKWDGSKFVNSLTQDNGTYLNIGANLYLAHSASQFGPNLMYLTDYNNTNKNLFRIDAFGSASQFVLRHTYGGASTCTFTNYNLVDWSYNYMVAGFGKYNHSLFAQCTNGQQNAFGVYNTNSDTYVFRVTDSGIIQLKSVNATATTTIAEFLDNSGNQKAKLTNGGLIVGSGTRRVNAQIQSSSTSQGLLPNKLTTAQRDAVTWTSDDAGMVIYNTDTNKHEGWNGSSWNQFY
jgi:hypothetical protein